MKLSTARKLWCMSYFPLPANIAMGLATATRIVCSGDTKRFLFPDGSVIESTKGNWKVVGMEKNPKLEAAVKRFGSGQVLPDRPWPRDGVNPLLASTPIRLDGKIPTTEIVDECFCVEHGMHIEQLKKEREALQELCNEKDEQLDKASRPMVVRLDWWAVGLVGLVLVAHYGFGVL